MVTPETLAGSGWFTPDDETAAEIAEVDGAPETVGAAALTLPTSPEQGSSLYKDADEAPLADLLRDGDGLAPLSFEYTSEGQAPALQIRLNNANLHDDEDRAGSDIGFATIVWSPPAADGWSTADPGDDDQFWVTRTLEGEDGEPIPSNTRMTLDEIIEVRELIEVPTVGRVAAMATSEQVALLRPLADRLNETAAAGDLQEFIATDTTFHLRLLGIAGNQRLVEEVGRLRGMARLSALRRLYEEGRLGATAREHHDLLDLVEARDVAGAEALMRRHLGHVRGVWAGREEG